MDPRISQTVSGMLGPCFEVIRRLSQEAHSDEMVVVLDKGDAGRQVMQALRLEQVEPRDATFIVAVLRRQSLIVALGKCGFADANVANRVNIYRMPIALVASGKVLLVEHGGLRFNGPLKL